MADQDGLYDASLGSLPTLIVPDDPENGAIEKPKSPPPSARVVDPAPQSARVVEPAPPSARAADPVPLSARVAETAQPSARQPSARTPRPPSVVAPSAEAAPPLADPPLPSPRPQTDPAPQPATAVDPPPPAATQVDSKDYRAMAKRAIALAKQDRLAGGNKSVFDANMADIGALGIGMQLYFMLTKYLAITFLLMGLVSLPAIVVNLYGNGVSDSMADPLQLAYSSLGNQGVCAEIKSDADLCLPKGDIDCNWTTVSTPFTSDPQTVSWIITLSDVSYSLVFFGFYLVYRYHAQRAIDNHMNENLTPAKYAVFVRGLPPDATEQEILSFFNTRYDPTKDEEYNPLWLGCCWGRRRKLGRAASASRNAVNKSTVQNLDHLAGTNSITKELYLNTWIAEVSIGHPTGGLLKTFLSMEALTRRVAETEELVRCLEAEKQTLPRSGKRAFKPADEKLLVRATAQLALLHAQLEKKTSKIKALKKGKAATTTSVTENKAAPASTKPIASAAALRKRAEAAAKATQHAFDWDACECAFVVFNNVESRRRCLQDYRASTRWLPRRFSPQLLRFRDKHPLIVRPAPEPSNILWENLEVTDRGRFYRRSLTNFITFLLLLTSCGIISGAQSAQSEMKKKMVTAGFCDYTLPLVFYGNESFLAKTRLVWSLQWDANRTCSATADGKPRYHIAYTNGIVNPLAFNTTAKSYATSTRCTDPCIAEASNTTCHTMPCFDQALLDDGDVCETYPETNMLYCLCKDAVATSIKQHGLFNGPQKLWQEMTPCRGFITDYVTRNVFMYLAAAIVVVVNLLLKAILRGFATFEAHSSESAKASAIAIKMFGAQFLNTAIIVLVVNAAMGLKNFPLLGDLFQGRYSDFERDWYPTVGMGITMTMLINAFVPQAVLFVQMFIVAPLARCWKRRSIRTQAQMNKLYAGPEFDISVRYPLVLNSLFVTMAFCGGAPVLLFIASLTAWGTYWFDKLSVLHLYSVKTAYDEALGETALAVLPWTLALHLAFSVWMYGNQELLKSTTIDLNVVLNLLNIDVIDANGTVLSAAQLYNELYAEAAKVDVLGKHGLVVKVVRTNVMVVFLFLAVLVVGLLLSSVVGQLLWPLVRRTVGVLVTAVWRNVAAKWRRWRAARRKRQPKVHVDNVPNTTIESPESNINTSPENINTSPEDKATPPSLATVAPTPAPAGLLSPRARAQVVIPEFTDVFRKTVGRKFVPDKKLGFQKNAQGELVRVWQDETVRHGIKRLPGEHMRTWEAMQAPVKSYAIEANGKYRLAVAEIVAAAKRLKAASAAASTAAIAVADGAAVEAAIVATEPVAIASKKEEPQAPADEVPPVEVVTSDALEQVVIQAE